MKAKGKIFSRWIGTDYRHLKFDLNIDSTEEFDEMCGDITKLQSFIEDCESGCFIDYDGYAGEILLKEKVVWDKELRPSECLFYKKKLQALNEEYNGQLEIVWYNR